MRKEAIKSTSRMILPTAMAAAAMLLAGCNGGGSDGNDPASSQPTSTYSPPEGAIRDLSDVECKPDSHGVWSVKGTVSNSSEENQTYEVTVAVVKTKTSEVLGQKDFVVTLEPGKHRTIKASNIYKGAAESAQCVPVVTLKP